MVRKFIYMLACVLCAVVAHAQELRPTTYYMNSPDVSQIAKDIHSGKVVASDDALVYSIADSMSTLNDSTRPFYIFLVSKMLLNSKNVKLKQTLADYCRRYIQNTPDPALLLLFSKTVKPDYRYCWARALTDNIAITCDKTLVQCYKASRLLSLEVCRQENKDKLESIFNQVRSMLGIHGG